MEGLRAFGDKLDKQVSLLQKCWTLKGQLLSRAMIIHKQISEESLCSLMNFLARNELYVIIASFCEHLHDEQSILLRIGLFHQKLQLSYARLSFSRALRHFITFSMTFANPILFLLLARSSG